LSGVSFGKHRQQTVAVHKGQQNVSATDEEVSQFNVLKNQTPQGPEDKEIHNVVVDEKSFEDEFPIENENPYLEDNGK
jgi:hypothetical protein